MSDVSVIVCTYNRKEILEQCIHHLKEQDYSCDRFEVLVMDNNSTDGTGAMVNRIAQENSDFKLFVIGVKEQGLSYARNSGIQHASGQIVLFIDDDALAEPSWLGKMTALFDDAQVDGVGGKVILQFPSSKPRWMTKRFHGWLSEFIPVSETPYLIEESPWPVGCSMGFRAEAFQKIGGFNTDFGRKGKELIGGEETDLFNRMRKNGLKLWAQPEAVVYHVVPPERMNKTYFVNLNIKFGEQRVRNRLPISPGYRIYLTIRFLVEAIANIVLYGAFLMFTGKERSFLRYVMLKRTLTKIKTVIVSQ